MTDDYVKNSRETATPFFLFLVGVISSVAFGFWMKSYTAALFLFFFQSWLSHTISLLTYKGGSN